MRRLGRPKKPPNIVYIQQHKTVVPFTEAAQAYRRFKHIERKLNRNFERCIQRWENAFAGLSVCDINQSVVDEHIANHMKGLQPNSVARYVFILKAMLNDAHGRGMLDVVPRIKPPTFFDERDEHLTGAEVDKLMVWARKSLDVTEAMLLATLVYTGVRVNELCLLKGTDFGDTSLAVVKKKGKTRHTRNIPYAKTYADLFLPQHVAGAYGANLVFRDIATSPEVMSHQAARLLSAGCAAIGVTRNVRVHDLRHTFAFLCGTAGMDLGDLQILMGHANLAMTMRYRGFIKSRATDVMLKM